MVNSAIHRVIEYQAAATPDAAALVEGTVTVTYRELNQRANALARRLSESGLARGSVALVCMEPSVNLAIVLLAVLKAGGAYAWVEPGSHADIDLPSSFCILRAHRNGEQTFLAVDITSALAGCAAKPSPNLPILTRGSDAACAFLDRSGHPQVVVSHATVAALPMSGKPLNETARTMWSGAPGAFDLWLGLMSGATVALPAAAPTTAAA